ncbi:MAG: HNH endonuclease signature motif containing protein [Sterolibacterium sp.]
MLASIFPQRTLLARHREIISHDDVLELLDYDAETGVFTWKSRGESASERPWATKIWNKRFAGKRAGSVVRDYRRIGLFGVSYPASRLAWFYVHGEWPSDMIDHINHATDDDRISNLREVNNAENQRNRKPHKDNKSGVPGVRYEEKTGRWIALISIKGKRKNLGRFYSFNDAVKARRDAESANFYHKNHGVAV